MSTATTAPAAFPATAAAFRRWLKQHDACDPALAWTKGLDAASAWATCHRGDWMLWALGAADALPDAKTSELLICRFAREVVHLNPDPRVLACIETRERWARDETTDSERAAALAVSAAAPAAPAAWAAWAAEAAEAAGAARAARAAEAAGAARAAEAAGAAPAAAARAKQADIIREFLPVFPLAA